MATEAAITGQVPGYGSKAWLTVFILTLLATVSNLDRTMLALLVEPIRAEFGISDFQIGLLQGLAFGLFYACLGIPMGYLLDRFSRRWVLFGAVSFWSIAAAACGLARSFPQLFLARLGVGAGEAAMSPGAYSILSEVFPPRKLSMAISLYTIAGTAGSAIAMSLGGAVIEHLNRLGDQIVPILGSMAPWQMAFVITGLPGLLAAPLIFLVPETRKAKPLDGAIRQDEGEKISIRRLLWNHRSYYGCHFLAFGSVVLLGYATGAWFPTHLVRNFAMPIGEVGLLLGATSTLGGVAGALCAGFVGDRWFSRGIYNAQFRYGLIAASALTITGVVGCLSTWLPLTIACSTVMFFFISISGGGAAHLQIVTPSACRGRVSSVYVLVINLMGLVAGPLIVSGLTDFLFHDPKKVGASLAITFAVVGTMGVLLFARGLKHATAAVERAEARTARSALL